MNKALRFVRDGFVTVVLRSPLHRLLSGSLLLVSFRGRRSGQEHSRPVMFAGDERGLIIFVGHAEQKVWWRNLTERAPVRVRLRGLELEGYGEVVKQDAALTGRYLARFPSACAAIEEADEPVFVLVGELRRSA